VEQDDPDRVENRLQQADQARLGNRDRAEAPGEEDVGDRHLDHAEPDQQRRLRGIGAGDWAAGQGDPGAQRERSGQVVDAAQPDRVEVAEPAQADDHQGIGQAARQPECDPLALVGPPVPAVQNDGGDPQGRQADPGQRTSVGPLAEEEEAERDHPERGRALQEDGIGRRRRLDRRQVQPRHGAEGQAEGDHRRPDDPPRPGDEWHERKPREEVPVEGDRQAVKR
jgi:hypothetical protein